MNIDLSIFTKKEFLKNYKKYINPHFHHRYMNQTVLVDAST